LTDIPSARIDVQCLTGVACDRLFSGLQWGWY